MREAYGEGCAQPLDWKRQPELQSHGPSRSICVLKLMLRANPRSRSHCRGSLWLPLLRICAFTSLSLCLSPRMLAAAKSSPDFAAAQSPVACELCRVLVLPLVRVPVPSQGPAAPPVRD